MNSYKFPQILKRKLPSFEQVIFYLLILFLPTQLGKHFWPDFSFISGARIDYLSPTLYLTDVLNFILLILFLFKNLKFNHFKLIKNFKLKIKNYWQFLMLALFLLVGIFLSKSPLAGFYGLLKLFEFVFFGFYVSRNIRSVKEIAIISFIFSFGVLFESFLAIAQYINQSSVEGLFYYFGERAFNSQTLGIANASINGELILRPYATFSHPNVLAAFLLIGMTLIIFNFPTSPFRLRSRLRGASKFQGIILAFSLGTGTIALFLTLSRIAILLWIIIVGLWIVIYLKIFFKNLRFVIGLLVALVFIGSILVLSPIRYRFLDLSFLDESFVVRKDLIEKSVEMVKSSPVFGVGLNNFLVNLPNNQNLKTQNIFTYLQPVHNIILLVLSETGVIGFLFFSWFIYRTILNLKAQSSKLKTTTKNSKLILLLILLALGFFDHYFLTLQQGQLLFAFVLGLCWSKYKN